MKVAAVQFEHRADNKQYNLGRVGHFAGRAAAAGARLVVCPEMCLTGYWHLRRLDAEVLRGLAEPADGPSVSAVRLLARRLGAGVGAGFLESADGRLFNSYAVCLPDGTVHIHRKLHSFEHQAISSGDRYTVFDTPWGARTAILTCWDNNLIENVRACALAGASVLIAPHQTGGSASRSPHGMHPIPMACWDNRHTDPAAIEREFRGPNGRGWLMCAGSRPAPTTTACSSSSATESAAMTTKSAPATPWCSTPTAGSSPKRGRPRTRSSSPTSTSGWSRCPPDDAG